MDADQPVYLSSLDSHRFASVRKCRFIRQIRFDTGKIAALVELEPAVPGQDFGSPGDLRIFLLTTRFEGASLSPINEFPCFVFVALPRAEWNHDSETITSNELQVIAWGELYRSAEDAECHRLG